VDLRGKKVGFTSEVFGLYTPFDVQSSEWKVNPESYPGGRFESVLDLLTRFLTAAVGAGGL